MAISVNGWETALLHIAGYQFPPEPDVLFASGVIAVTKNPMMLADKIFWFISQQITKAVVGPLNDAILRHYENCDGLLYGLEIRLQLPNPALGSLKPSQRLLQFQFLPVVNAIRDSSCLKLLIAIDEAVTLLAPMTLRCRLGPDQTAQSVAPMIQGINGAPFPLPPESQSYPPPVQNPDQRFYP